MARRWSPGLGATRAGWRPGAVAFTPPAATSFWPHASPRGPRVDQRAALGRLPEPGRLAAARGRPRRPGGAAFRLAGSPPRRLRSTAALFDLTAGWPDLYAANVEGVRHVCAAARKRGVERVVTWSSSSIYGGTKRPVPLAETADIPLARLNPYAKSKYLGERLAREAATADRLDVIVLRPTEVYGRGSTKGLAQALFAFKAGAMSAVPGPGNVRHSYI